MALQLWAFVALVKRPPAPMPGEHFQLVAVFGGDPDRVEVAIHLCQRGIGDALVVSDSAPWMLDQYFQSYGRPGTAKVLLEPYARTTDQNARLIGRIIRREGFRRVLLVTSWYHVPRAYLLLRLALLGAGVELKVQSAEAVPDHFGSTPEFTLELFKLWGSLARWAKSTLRKHGMIPGESILPVD